MGQWWKRLKYAKDAGKLKNLRYLEDFLKNIWQFNCSGQTGQLLQNNKKKIQVTTNSIKNQG